MHKSFILIAMTICLVGCELFSKAKPDQDEAEHRRKLELIDAAIRLCSATIPEGKEISASIKLDIAEAIKSGKSSAEVKGEYLNKLKVIGVASSEGYYKCIENKWPADDRVAHTPVSIDRVADFRQISCDADKVILIDNILIDKDVVSYRPRATIPSYKKVALYDLLVSDSTEATTSSVVDQSAYGVPESAWRVSTKSTGDRSQARIKWVWLNGHRDPSKSYSNDLNSGILLRTAPEYVLIEATIKVLVPDDVRIINTTSTDCTLVEAKEGVSYSWRCAGLHRRVGKELNRVDIDWSWNMWSRCAA